MCFTQQNLLVQIHNFLVFSCLWHFTFLSLSHCLGEDSRVKFKEQILRMLLFIQWVVFFHQAASAENKQAEQVIQKDIKKNFYKAIFWLTL